MEMNKTYQLKEPKALIPRVNIATDLAIKKDYSVNSWFAIGHVETDGHTIDYLYHLMSMSYGLNTHS